MAGRSQPQARSLTPQHATDGDLKGNDMTAETVTTPAARWLVEGKPDPHGDRYNCERAALVMGDKTDDELANAVFLYDHRSGLGSIGLLTAAKDRIRWLSRALTAALAAAPSAAPPVPSDAPALDHDGSNVTDRHDNEDAALVSDASRWHFMPDEDDAPDLFFATEGEACAAQQGWRIARGFHPITGDCERSTPADPVNADILAALRDALEDQEAMMSDAAHVHGSADAAQAKWSALAGRIAASRAAIARAEGRA